MALRAGDVLADAYRLISLIGEGGMGCVWVAEHIALERRVAIKVITDEAIVHPQVRDRFLLEARATAKIRNEHVISVLDFNVTDEGQPFLVLELLTGETLEDRILRRGPLTLNDAQAVLEQTCSALTAAHSHGILHRDIKADNLFLQTSDRGIDLKVFDFGIAFNKFKAPVNRITAAQIPLGTPQYMSPEQIMATDEITEHSDIFSLGVCMYYALTGVFPFQGSNFAEIAVACLQGNFVAPSTLVPSLPVALDAWFSRALASERKARFGTPSAMRAAFAAAMPSRVVKDTPMAVEVDFDRPTLNLQKARKFRLGWAIAGAAIAVLALSVSVQQARTMSVQLGETQAPQVLGAEMQPLSVMVALPKPQSSVIVVAPPANLVAPVAPIKQRTAGVGSKVATGMTDAAAPEVETTPYDPTELVGNDQADASSVVP